MTLKILLYVGIDWITRRAICGSPFRMLPIPCDKATWIKQDDNQASHQCKKSPWPTFKFNGQVFTYSQNDSQPSWDVHLTLKRSHKTSMHGWLLWEIHQTSCCQTSTLPAAAQKRVRGQAAMAAATSGPFQRWQSYHCQVSSRRVSITIIWCT